MGFQSLGKSGEVTYTANKIHNGSLTIVIKTKWCKPGSYIGHLFKLGAILYKIH